MHATVGLLLALACTAEAFAPGAVPLTGSRTVCTLALVSFVCGYVHVRPQHLSKSAEAWTVRADCSTAGSRILSCGADGESRAMVWLPHVCILSPILCDAALPCGDKAQRDCNVSHWSCVPEIPRCWPCPNEPPRGASPCGFFAISCPKIIYAGLPYSFRLSRDRATCSVCFTNAR